MPSNVAFISVGSNIGDKLRNCRNALAALTAGGMAVLKRQSHFYRTEPVDYAEQEWFVNAVVEIETAREPMMLLSELKSIETAAGRERGGVRFGPRLLDLDILLYDSVIFDSPELIIPHPRMHKRRFVLQPMCDINKKLIHPVLKMDMETLLAALPEYEQRIIRIQ